MTRHSHTSGHEAPPAHLDWFTINAWLGALAIGLAVLGLIIWLAASLWTGPQGREGERPSAAWAARLPASEESQGADAPPAPEATR